MARKKDEEVKQGLPEWMGTYGDMVTLLLCFFVLLFASSSVDAGKFNEIIRSFSNSPISITDKNREGILDTLGNGIIAMPEVKGESDEEYEKNREEGEQELQKMVETFKSYFAENNLESKVQIEKDERSITINFSDGILFDSGKANIKEGATDILYSIGSELLNHPDNDIKIEGHTDNVPIKTAVYPNNWYLSAARAISVAIFFMEKNGFDPERISTEGYGEYRPKYSNDTADNRALNRRVEIRIMSKFYSGENY